MEKRYRTALPEMTSNDRRLLFVAIAQGVTKHLRDHAEDGFEVKVRAEQINTDHWIQSSSETGPPIPIPMVGHKHSVTVT